MVMLWGPNSPDGHVHQRDLAAAASHESDQQKWHHRHWFQGAKDCRLGSPSLCATEAENSGVLGMTHGIFRWMCFFLGGWKERDDKHIWKTNWLVPSKNNCRFLSGWHPASLWSKVHQELSDELDEKVKYVLALVRLFPMKRGIRCSSQVTTLAKFPY